MIYAWVNVIKNRFFGKLLKFFNYVDINFLIIKKRHKMLKLNILTDTFIVEKINQMNRCDFSYVSIGYQHSGNADIFGCFINHDWMIHYANEKLYKDDPLLEASDKFKNQPIPWNSLCLGTKKKVSVMNMRYALAHINTGITISSTTNNGVKRVLAVGDCCNENLIFEKYINSLPLFNNFAGISVACGRDG